MRSELVAGTGWQESRESRADFGLAALRRGAVFASSPSLGDDLGLSRPVKPAPESCSVVTSAPPVASVTTIRPAGRMFPPTVAEEPVKEPSSMVATTDLVEPPEATRAVTTIALPPAIPAGPAPRKGRQLGAALAGIALAALCAGGFAVTKRDRAATATPATAAEAPVVQTLAADVDPTPAAEPPPETIELGPTEGAPSADAKAEPKRLGLGKLTIKDAARSKNVWLDGKRMLGAGNRTFLVACGMHTIAVTEKTDMKDIEIPCNGEYTVSK